MRFTMVVPDNAPSGTKLHCQAPDGQELRLTVPEGVPPGSVMTLTLEPGTKSWKCMAEPPEVDRAPPMQSNTVSETVMTYATGQPPVITTYSSLGGAPTVRSADQYQQQPYPPPQGYGGQLPYGVQQMPVNLSYVPPPPGQAGCMAHPGSFVTPGFQPPMPRPDQLHAPQMYYPGSGPLPMENRPSYTPPPGAMMENRPSYTPMPMPQQHMVYQQRVMPQPGASYVPAPMIRHPSYVPPPGTAFSAPSAPSTMGAAEAGTAPGVQPQGPAVTNLPPQTFPGQPTVIHHNLPPGTIMQPQYPGMPPQPMPQGMQQPMIPGMAPPPQFQLRAPFPHQPGSMMQFPGLRPNMMQPPSLAPFNGVQPISSMGGALPQTAPEGGAPVQ